MGIILSIVGVIFAFGLIIFIHEFGHFIVAKKSGVQVDKFSFGFGKEIFGFQWGETRYTVNWLPLGGYVKMAGEIPEDYEGPVLEGQGSPPKEDERRDKSREFMGLVWYRRIPIVLAGPAMNYVMAAFIFFMAMLWWGEMVRVPTNEVGLVVDGKPAQVAGLKSGDIIIQVDGNEIITFNDIRKYVEDAPGKQMTFLIRRGEEEKEILIVPEKSGEKGKIGITAGSMIFEHEKVSVPQAIGKSIVRCWDISAMTIYHIYSSFVTRTKPDFAGPVGIVKIINMSVKEGWEYYWRLIGLLSVAIGLLNLFPIPLLDGGHLVYFIIEGIRGKPLSTRAMAKANMVGLVLLLSLVIFATYNDVTRKWPDEKPAVEETQK
jgi:regulator of sigma E protease